VRDDGSLSRRAIYGGASLLVLIVFAILGLILARLLAGYITADDSGERDKVSLQAIAQAKAGLIAYAVAVQPDTYAKRPGEMPCPDLDNDGDAEITCFQANQRIGRLPWKTLKLPDLRDGHGERLWYALSGTFQRKTFNQCPTSGGPACLNSDTHGTITLRNSIGSVVLDGSGIDGGAIAVLMAAGPVTTRLGANRPQDRSCNGDADIRKCERTGVCSGSTTALCQPSNYLELVDSSVLPLREARNSMEDNAEFSDGARDNGFITGPARDAQGNIVVNDVIVPISYQDLMPLLEQRIAGEALKCLHDYAATGTGRFPWAAPSNSDYGVPLSDRAGERWGRIPQTLNATRASNGAMNATWPSDCPIAMDVSKKAWWANWKDQVFFAVARGLAPDAASPSCAGGCLSVGPSPSKADTHVVVVLAGRALPGQVRTVGASADNYLEPPNAAGGTQFERRSASTSVDDLVVFE
jgi:type II secretory pathway pseudopilin PulG